MNERKTKKYQGFESINKTIIKTAKEKKLVGALNKYKAIKNWDKAASSFISEAKEYSKAVDLKNGILVVACLSREIASQIKFIAQRIIEALNQLIGRQVVFAIHIEV